MAATVPVCILSKIPNLAKLIATRLPHVSILNVKETTEGGEKVYWRCTGLLDSDDRRQLENAEVLLADPLEVAHHDLVQNLPNLKWMQSTWAGVDGMIRALDKTKPFPQYTVTKFSGFFGGPMSEYVIAQMVARERNSLAIQADQKRHIWDYYGRAYFRALSELTLGILGVGDIGRHVAKAAKTFGMRVFGLVSKVPENTSCDLVDEYRDMSGLRELLAESDYVCNILPHTPATVGLLNGDVLKPCSKKKSCLINIGRGSIISNSTVIRALDEGWLGHTILDVVEEEPLPADSALWDHPEVTITPHVSGISRDEPLADLFVENYTRFLANQELKFIVDWNKGY